MRDDVCNIHFDQKYSYLAYLSTFEVENTTKSSPIKTEIKLNTP